VASLTHWEQFFANKYEVVATLVPDDPEVGLLIRFVGAMWLSSFLLFRFP
jgi:hypothetical protein